MNLELNNKEFAKLYVEAFYGEQEKTINRLFNSLFFISLIGCYIYYSIGYISTKIAGDFVPNTVTESYSISLICSLLILLIYFGGLSGARPIIITYCLVFFVSVFSTFTGFLILFFWFEFFVLLLEINLTKVVSNYFVQLIFIIFTGYRMYSIIIDFLKRKKILYGYLEKSNFIYMSIMIFAVSMLSLMTGLDANETTSEILLVITSSILFPYIDLIKKFG